MKITLLDSRDFTHTLNLPEKEELHIWSFLHTPAGDVDNLHKNVREYAHRLLRLLLSRYTGIPAEHLEFGEGTHGKPYLIQKPELYFNLSHSGQAIMFVFSITSPVGIDIENTSRTADFGKIAARTFLPEEQTRLISLTGEEQKLEFFRYWTRTESFLKGIGTGFSASFTDKNIQKEYSFWTVQSVPAPPGYLCSVAYRNTL